MKTLMSAIMTFFGRKEGQTLAEFRDELHQLTDKDKAELGVMLAEHYGEEIQVGPASA